MSLTSDYCNSLKKFKWIIQHFDQKFEQVNKLFISRNQTNTFRDPHFYAFGYHVYRILPRSIIWLVSVLINKLMSYHSPGFLMSTPTLVHCPPVRDHTSKRLLYKVDSRLLSSPTSLTRSTSLAAYVELPFPYNNPNLWL